MRLLLLFCLLLPWTTAQRILRVPIFQDPSTLDPYLSARLADFIVFAQIFESPLQCVEGPDSTVQLAPAICDLPQVSSDGLTVKLRVRAGVRFADDPCFPGGAGREIAPLDVARIFLRHANPFVASAYYAQFVEGHIKGLDGWREKSRKDHLADENLDLVEGLAIQGRDLIIKLLAPFPQLSALLSQPWASVVPREALDRYGSAFGEGHPVGSGPFIFQKQDPLGTVHLLRNPHYRLAGLPGVDELRLVLITDVDQETRRFQQGELDVAQIFPANTKVFLTSRGHLKKNWRMRGYALFQAPALDISYLLFNCQNPFLKKKAVRQAISLSIRRDRWMDPIFGVRGVEADGPVPSGLPEHRRIARVPFGLGRRDLKRARKLLASVGHLEGQGLPELLVDAPDVHKDPTNLAALRGMMSDIAALGIRTQDRTSDWPTFMARARRGDFNILWVSWNADYPDVENFLGLFQSQATLDNGGYNYGHYRNPRYDQLYERFSKLAPGIRRTDLVQEMVGILQEEAPWVYLRFGREVSVTAPHLTGYHPQRMNFSLRDVVLFKHR